MGPVPPQQQISHFPFGIFISTDTQHGTIQHPIHVHNAHSNASRGGAAASSLGSAVSCRVEGRAIDTALGQCFIPNSSH